MNISNIIKIPEIMLQIKSYKLPQWSAQTFPHGSSEKCGQKGKGPCILLL